MPEEKIGEVAHYFGKIGVAAVRVMGSGLKVGDTVRFRGKSTDFEQTIDSIQIEHDSVESAGPGDEVGVKVGEKVREGDGVFKITA